MPELQKELADLALADRHITEAHARIAAHRLTVDHLKEIGGNTTQADVLLVTMQQTLEQFHAHRSLILAALESRKQPSKPIE